MQTMNALDVQKKVMLGCSAMIVHETHLSVFFVCLVGWFFFLSIIIVGNTIDRF